MATKTKPAESSVVHSDITRISVALQGKPPGLMFQGKGLMKAQGDKPAKPLPPEKEAELRAHWMGEGKSRQLCIPSVMLYNSICKAGGHFKFKGQTKMSSIVASTVAFEQDRIPLGISTFNTHVEYCRIPPGKGGAMVEIGRPVIPEWKAEFTLLVDAEMYDPNVLREILIHAGKMIGIGAGRPELKRPYGKFSVVEFEIL